MNLIEKLIDEKIVNNNFHGSNMLNVLRCGDLANDNERLARCRLYHAWKMSGENKKIARQRAIEGITPPPQMVFSETANEDVPKDYIIGEAGLG